MKHLSAWLAHVTGGLFWRTFGLLTLLIGVSLAAWYQNFKVLEREPRAQQAAQLIVSSINLTRSALIHAHPSERKALLADWARNENLRIYPLENDDVVELENDIPLARSLRAQLGKIGEDNFKLASEVNKQAGVWVSFEIEGDAYWLRFERARLEHGSNLRWLSWGAVSMLLSLLGALLLTRLINQPLARLAHAAVEIGRGKTPEILPEKGVTEVREANQSFNHMVRELSELEQNRALMLAGISHDLRTPLTRVRLELEMLKMGDDTRQALEADITQINQSVAQFMDYANDSPLKLSRLSLQTAVHEAIERFARQDDLKIVATNLDYFCQADKFVLARALDNLLENARRYGRGINSECAQVEIHAEIENKYTVLSISDQGTGVSVTQLEKIRQPFYRVDQARQDAVGSGLGLAIVERLMQRLGGKLELSNRPQGGLCAKLYLQKA